MPLTVVVNVPPRGREVLERLVRSGQEALAEDRLADAERDLTEAADIGLRLVEQETTRTGSASALGMLGVRDQRQRGQRGRVAGLVDRWVPRADEAARALGTLLSTLPEHGRQAGDVAARAAAARSRLLAGAGLG